jgi:Kef-type K+ transport system membrane component KefB
LNADHALGLFLVGLAVLILLGRFLGRALLRVGQPAVLGEILAGILIGPSFLATVAPGVVDALFPAEAIALLSAVGNVGLVLFVFLIALQIDRPMLQRHLGQVMKVSVGSFLLPFCVGVAIAGPLQVVDPEMDGEKAELAFALFIGTALSITAFPVLARILTAQELESTALGTLSLAVAGILDLSGWMLLALVLAVAAGNGAGDLLRIAVAVLSLVVIVMKVVVPLLRFGLGRVGSGGKIAKISLLASALFACAGTTQLIGLHSVLGALLLGVMFPRRDLDDLLGSVREELSAVAVAALLPVYFAIAGMGVNLSTFGAENLVETTLLLAIATATKMAGTILGARWGGLTWSDGLPLGVLMNTRGLMEVVLLNIGLAGGILDETLYSELMLVALIATLMTSPTIRHLRARSSGRLWCEAGQVRESPRPRAAF